MNSKTEYNRSAVPRLTSKMGEHQFKKWEKEEENDKERNEELESRIRMMRKERNKERRRPAQLHQPAEKRRKLEGGVKGIRKAWGRPVGGGSVGKRPPTVTELLPEPVMKKYKFEEGVTDRYAEFGENISPQYYNWEGKMA